MRQFSLNEDEIWLVSKLRMLEIAQQEVIYFLIRRMSTGLPLPDLAGENIVDLSAPLRQRKPN